MGNTSSKLTTTRDHTRHSRRKISSAKKSKSKVGSIPTDPLVRLTHTLRECWREHVRVKSDFARKEADIIGMAASLRLITTKVGPQRFAKTWHITSKGLAWLNEKED